MLKRTSAWPSIRLVACVLVTASTFVVTAAHADGERALVAIEWRAPDGCASVEDVMLGTEAVLEEPTFVRNDPSTSGRPEPTPVVRGRVTRNDGEWIARVDLVDAAGGRVGARQLTVAGPDCRAIDESLHLVLALAVDRLRKQEDSAVHVTASVPWRGEVALAFDSGVGVLPSVLLAPGLSGRIDPPGLTSITARLSVWIPQTETNDAGYGGEVWGIESALGLCLAIIDDIRWGMEGCGEGSIAYISATGVGFDAADSRSVQGRFISARLLLAGRLTLSERFALRLTGGAYALLESARLNLLTADGDRIAHHEPSTFGPWIRLEVALRFP